MSSAKKRSPPERRKTFVRIPTEQDLEMQILKQKRKPLREIMEQFAPIKDVDGSDLTKN
jgi:hypothetical protein